MQYFTILQHKLHSFNIQDDRTTRMLLPKPLKKIPKSHIRPAGSHFCSACCSECLNEHTRVKLQHNKEIMMFIFYLMVLSMCNCLKAFDTRGILSTPASDWKADWKQTAQRLKLQERLSTINKRNIIRWNIYRDNIFHSRRQVLKCL